MKCKSVFIAVALTVLWLSGGVWASPTTAYEAQRVVTGWLQSDVQPLGMALGRSVSEAESFEDDEGREIYYVVHLQPSGFVIVPADDEIEPIIAFTNDGTYDPSSANPLGALVTSDLNGRMTTMRNLIAPHVNVVDRSQSKWRDLLERAENPGNEFGLMSLVCVSDVRVIPLIQSEWGQATACRLPCYNYYVPKQYPAGCLATSMAQVMRYFQYPTAGIGVHEFEITVDELKQTAQTRGGDGVGGPYRWEDMPLEPESDCSAFTQIHRQAIGALCYDAAVTVKMGFESGGSSSFMRDGKNALLNTFRYENAIMAYDAGRDISRHLTEIINPNLDAKIPVILAIINPDQQNSGHAVVCDGYGYDTETVYHHLNMGWVGMSDIWYNLPDIDSSKGRFASVFGCIYNIQISGSGEIVSGRVLDVEGQPVVNVAVYAGDTGQVPHEVITDSRGIYAFVGLDPNTAYTVWPGSDGYAFSSRSVITGNSLDDANSSGNRWGVDFLAEAMLNPPTPGLIYVDADAPGDPQPDDPTQSDPLENGSAEHPFDAIQDAIDVAVPGDIVIILEGTYSGEGNRDLDFKGKAITVRSEDPNELDLVIIDCQGSVEEPHRGFIFQSYETSSSVLDGLTVRGGYYERGGGIYCKDCAQPTITNCTFDLNSASLGGAMYNQSAGPTLIDCTFSRNTSDAGAIYNYGELAACSPVLSDCVFYANTALYNGGAMYNLGQYAQPELTNCTFTWNSASTGGGGAIRNNVSAGVTITNCLFAKNTAETFGGAIRCSNGSRATLTNCTLSDNSAPDGNALACTLDDGRLKSPCTVDILNSILWNGGSEIYNTDGSTITVTYSNVEGGDGNATWPGDGNTDTNPLFADPTGGDYHLKSEAGRWNPKSQTWLLDERTSPCIDAGDPMTPFGLEPLPNGDVINIGAYGGTLEASKSQPHL
ncbi:MAG: C10 family peptidase [Sedimentisphaerales bacterium]|nr:C10 family peptidase [Sedimentisphaerales bacterium]